LGFSICPPDVEELAERYCLDRLDPAAAEAFENHYLACPKCALAAREALDFVQAFRTVARVPG
jgi:hypothetical protein